MNTLQTVECENLVCRAKVLPLLYRMGRIITESEDLQETTPVLLKIMEEHLEVRCVMLTLYQRNTGTIFIHESLGLTEEEKARGVYNVGEGITGKVVENGQAIIVPKIKDEPNFLGRARSRNSEDLDSSFICVPIRRGKTVFGALSLEKFYMVPEILHADVELLDFLASIIAQAVEIYLLKHEEVVHWESENRRLQDALKKRFHPSNIIGNSSVMREVYAMIEKIAKSRITVLILGESGVGKELVANAIHYNSFCADGPFVKFNCAALPESIIESELFGHEKGAFTGADTARKGRFEEADGGTIFLDEIGELSLGMQAKLLRVLQEKTFERVGGNKSIRVNIRILAATNRDLQSRVAEGKFREDLFYRLNVLPITIPPLRERGSDIINLSDYFVVKFAKENDKKVTRISTPALQMLMNYSWPGNVRELENVMERAVILCEDEVVHGYNLPPSLQDATISGTSERSALDSKLESIEYEYIVDALKKSHGNMTEAARELGMTRRILGLRMQKYKMDFRHFRNSQTSME
ncbi:MAG TPA: sigma 54-interacting transcriptional regulator [Fibrobacteraceae bacterium]|nr:sigma 54-interacting transcriptional regulator [Fibrobacteraceae bacterium]